MNILKPWKFQFDEMANNPSNLIQNEEHVILTNSIPFPLNEGVFYLKDLVVRDSITNEELTIKIDYVLDGQDSYVTARTGNPTATVIEIKDKAYSGTVLITYRVVGGAEGVPIGMVKDLLIALQTVVNNTSVDYTKNIINLPVFFPPNPHGHSLESLDQIELLVQSQRDLFNALINRIPMMDSGNSLQEQINRMLGLIGSLRNSVNSVQSMQGSAERLDQILSQIAELENMSSADVPVQANSTVLLGSWDINDVSSVRGVVTAKTANHVDTRDFCLVCPALGNPQITEYGIMSTGNLFIQLTADRLGDEIRLSVRMQEAGQVKTKLISAL